MREIAGNGDDEARTPHHQPRQDHTAAAVARWWRDRHLAARVEDQTVNAALAPLLHDVEMYFPARSRAAGRAGGPTVSETFTVRGFEGNQGVGCQVVWASGDPLAGLESRHIRVTLCTRPEVDRGLPAELFFRFRGSPIR